MTKLENAIQKSFPIVRMEKDDIVEIGEIIQETCTGIRITASERQLKDISDIGRVARREITNFEITAKNPYITVKLRGKEARYYIREGLDIKMKEIARTFDEIISAKAAKVLRAFTSVWVILAYFAFFILLCMCSPEKPHGLAAGKGVSPEALLMGFVTMLWCGFAARTRFQRYSVVFMKRPVTFTDLLYRHRESAIMIFFTLAMIIAPILSVFVIYRYY